MGFDGDGDVEEYGGEEMPEAKPPWIRPLDPASFHRARRKE